ncbi:MAG: HD domain-containing phosphohydrolase [Pseudomonadota bacterium]
MSAQLLPLIRSKVVLGQPLPWNVRDRQGGLLLRQGHVVDTEKQLELLLERGATVNADEARAAARAEQTAVTDARRPHLLSVFDLWNGLALRLKAVWHSLPLEQEFTAGVDTLAHELIALSQREPDIGIFLMVRQERSNHIDYAYNHSVHTAMVCVLLARRLEWPQHEMESLVRAALTMNLSIGELQGRMASQDFPMLERQEAQIRRHPHEVAGLLATAGVTDEAWLRTVRDHHEHVDGSGYPLGKSEVDRLAQALRLADVFCAKLTPRLIRAPLSPQEAERRLYAEGKVDAGVMVLAMALIHELGIYPPGDLVQLKSGELAVVVKRGAHAKTPLVATLTDTQGRPIVATHRRDTSDPLYAVTGAVTQKALVARLPPERVFGYALA